VTAAVQAVKQVERIPHPGGDLEGFPQPCTRLRDAARALVHDRHQTQEGCLTAQVACPLGLSQPVSAVLPGGGFVAGFEQG
jgi:hypothetical protein